MISVVRSIKTQQLQQTVNAGAPTWLSVAGLALGGSAVGQGRDAFLGWLQGFLPPSAPVSPVR